MPILQTFKDEGRAPVKIWTDEVEASALQQLHNLSSLPFIHKHVAIMPDVHWGMGATVGSVIPTKGAIVPAAVIMIDSVDAGLIANIPTGAASFRERFKRPYIVIHRVDLHRILLDACAGHGNIELMPLTEATHYEDMGNRVLLRTAGNGVIDAAAIVGADGLRSTISAHHFVTSSSSLSCGTTAFTRPISYASFAE